MRHYRVLLTAGDKQRTQPGCWHNERYIIYQYRFLIVPEETHTLGGLFNRAEHYHFRIAQSIEHTIPPCHKLNYLYRFIGLNKVYRIAFILVIITIDEGTGLCSGAVYFDYRRGVAYCYFIGTCSVLRYSV